MRKGLKCNIITYGSLIQAAEQRGKWEMALWFSDRMEKDKIAPNTMTFNALLSACAQGLLPSSLESGSPWHCMCIIGPSFDLAIPEAFTQTKKLVTETHQLLGSRPLTGDVQSATESLTFFMLRPINCPYPPCVACAWTEATLWSFSGKTIQAVCTHSSFSYSRKSKFFLGYVPNALMLVSLFWLVRRLMITAFLAIICHGLDVMSECLGRLLRPIWSRC